MRVLAHIEKLDDCFGQFLVRVTCTGMGKLKIARELSCGVSTVQRILAG